MSQQHRRATHLSVTRVGGCKHKRKFTNKFTRGKRKEQESRRIRCNRHSQPHSTRGRRREGGPQCLRAWVEKETGTVNGNELAVARWRHRPLTALQSVTIHPTGSRMRSACVSRDCCVHMRALVFMLYACLRKIKGRRLHVFFRLWSILPRQIPSKGFGYSAMVAPQTIHGSSLHLSASAPACCSCWPAR